MEVEGDSLFASGQLKIKIGNSTRTKRNPSPRRLQESRREGERDQARDTRVRGDLGRGLNARHRGSARERGVQEKL